MSLALTEKIHDNPNVMGECSTFNRIEEGVIFLRMNLDMSTAVHEFMHWHDAKAGWASGLRREGLQGKCMLSSFAHAQYVHSDKGKTFVPDWARKAIDHVESFMASHPTYMGKLKELDVRCPTSPLS